MRLIKPNDSLKFLGFSEFDIINLDKIVCSKNLSDFIELELINDQPFDFDNFIHLAISNKMFRELLLKTCYEELNDFPNCIFRNINIKPESNSFKLNLFLLLIDSLKNKNAIDPMYLELLKIDEHGDRKVNTLIDSFFEMCRRGWFNKINIFNLFAESNTLERIGWTGTNVPTPHKESIAEHMYVMYTMANLYLPNCYNELGYDKNKVLNMIMIHDLAETVTGDIPHPNKTSDDDLKEDLIARALWCNLLYNESPASIDIYEAWNDWSLNLTINAKIAHDFDAIQLNYQFFTYACKYPETYSDENILQWTRRQPITKIGKEIYKEVILNNPKFKSRISVIKGVYYND
jgi:5'-deoxynucleotidase YfbR-like HD superfamily hydrolase